MVAWFKSFCPTACCILAGKSVFSVNSGTLSDSKSFCLLTLSFLCTCSAGPEEEEEEEEEEKEQDEEGGFYLLSEAFISPNHFLTECNDKSNTICLHHAWTKKIVGFTFVMFFIVCSLSLTGKLIEDGPCFNGNAFELIELPQ